MIYLPRVSAITFVMISMLFTSKSLAGIEVIKDHYKRIQNESTLQVSQSLRIHPRADLENEKSQFYAHIQEKSIQMEQIVETALSVFETEDGRFVEQTFSEAETSIKRIVQSIVENDLPPLQEHSNAQVDIIFGSIPEMLPDMKRLVASFYQSWRQETLVLPAYFMRYLTYSRLEREAVQRNEFSTLHEAKPTPMEYEQEALLETHQKVSDRTCGICFQSASAENPFGKLKHCQHPTFYHQSCLEKHLLSRCQSHSLSHCTCPFSTCSAKAVDCDISKGAFLPELLHYWRRDLEGMEPRIKKYLLCKTENCPGIALRKPGQKSFLCPGCRTSFCFECRNAHSDDMSCEVAKARADTADRSMKRLNELNVVQRCKRCESPYIRIDACPKVRCTCGYENVYIGNFREVNTTCNWNSVQQDPPLQAIQEEVRDLERGDAK